MPAVKKAAMLLAALLLCLFWTLALAPDALAYETTLPEGMQTLLAQDYPGWTITYQAWLYADEDAALLILSKEGKCTAVIVEPSQDGCAVTAQNDRLVPDGAAVDTQQWWIQDKNNDGRPYIWYSPEEGDSFYYDLAKDESGVWRITAGDFTKRGLYEETSLHFDVANQGTALRVYTESYFSAVYAPLTVELAFSDFDPDLVQAACADIVTHDNDPMLIPSTGEADALPQGQVIDFPSDMSYPVYAGPGEDYLRLGDDWDATVSTNGWIQVFGREGDWLLIQYNVREGRNRFGYITASALPEGTDVPELSFTWRAAVLDGSATDDPLRTWAETDRFENVDCWQLATFGDEVYVEIVTDALRYRGFVQGVTLREDHAKDAVTVAEGATLYSDEALENPTATLPGGIATTVLTNAGDAVQVRVGGEPCSIEGWVRADTLLIGALTTDVDAPSNLVVIMAPESANDSNTGFLLPMEDAERTGASDYGFYRSLAIMDGFRLVQEESTDALTVFIPEDWVVALTEGSPYGKGIIAVTLAWDAAVTVTQDPASRQTILLYKGTTVNVVQMGDVCLTEDGQLLNKSAKLNTFGYLQTDALIPQTDAQLAVGLLTPSNGADCAILKATLNGGYGSVYGYGTRLILMGETEESYLVRTPGGDYGYFDKADVTPTVQTARQADYETLAYAAGTLTCESGYWRQPYSQTQEAGKWPAGTQVALLADLQDWWCLWKDGCTGFVPTDRLSGLPDDAPVYAGIYNAFRDEPFVPTWKVTPPLFHTDTDAWLLLESDGGICLAHRTLQEGKWTQAGTTAALLGDAVRQVDTLTGDDRRMAIGLYLNDDDSTQMKLTFVRSGEDWQMISVRLMAYGTDGSFGTRLYDRLFTPGDGGLTLSEGGNTQFLPLSEGCETLLTRLDAGVLFSQCKQAYQESGREW